MFLFCFSCSRGFYIKWSSGSNGMSKICDIRNEGVKNHKIKTNIISGSTPQTVLQVEIVSILASIWIIDQVIRIEM